MLFHEEGGRVGLGKKVILHDKEGWGRQAKSDFYDKGGLGVGQQVFFPHKEWEECFFIISRPIVGP